MRDFFRPGRSPVMATKAAIATSHPLATAAGLDILRAGGNAVDAALAGVAVQCVVEPQMTGIGGDCFVLYAPAGGDPVGLNGSGRAPAAASAARLREAGFTVLPHETPHAVTIPGAVSAWTRLHADYGTLPLDRLFAAAIDYAENGYPVTPRVASDWAVAAAQLANGEGTGDLFLRGGIPYAAGERHSQPLLGQRLREIARDGAAAFYTGATAKALVQRLRALGGVHTEEDFAEGLDGANYVAPVSTGYRGYDVLEIPPNGQGLVALMILNVIGGFDLSADVPMDERIHIHAEATKLAYHHRDAFVCDPDHAPCAVETLLGAETTAALRRRVSLERAGEPALWTEPEHRDTVYLSVVDRDGNAISFINSLFQAFGSYILDPATGVLLHSRGSSFRLIEGHPNELAPRKRPLHTIIPGLLRRDGRTVMPFGVMGGHYQAAGHAAFLSGLLDRGLDLQEAIDAPRSFAFNGELEVEPTIAPETVAKLEAKGHCVKPAARPIGGAQAVWIDHERGLLHAGSDPRKDGCALGF
ncbi:gamma-glutamyltransferase family protein [Propylenella binzhouense]|uniref:Gamma-glutamyltransferase family protein n=1 Tax=Propylenella binzhouense TaxID=2555902 RepID=A0A964T972_9HYPH|nr:gamma-glutamyltransferase family protein [Propylenella binzhouense]MYZ49647.1 gamma-glutamyltransferase family protein [Propylenella binzhouense]